MKLGTRAITSMVMVSFMMSAITMALVAYSYKAIPDRIEQDQRGRIEERKLRIKEIEATRALAEVSDELANTALKILEATEE